MTYMVSLELVCSLTY